MIFWEEIVWFTDESRKQQLWSRLKNKRACYKEMVKDTISFIFHLKLGKVVILFYRNILRRNKKGCFSDPTDLLLLSQVGVDVAQVHGDLEEPRYHRHVKGGGVLKKKTVVIQYGSFRD